MKEAFEKIKERLEDVKGIAFLTLANTGDKTRDIVYDEVMVYMNTAIEIVNQVAEEYGKDTNVPVNEEFCEWESDFNYFSGKSKKETGCGYTFYDLHHAEPFKFCPYCRKKIKVVK